MLLESASTIYFAVASQRAESSGSEGATTIGGDPAVWMLVFWVSMFWGAYTYLLYPLLVAGLGFFRRRSKTDLAEPSSPGSDSLASIAGDPSPTVAFLIAAYNEEAILAEKLENTLALEGLDPERSNIVVLSDGSTDRTDEIVQSFGPRGVQLLRVEGRLGKTHAQNQGVQATDGEILVFSDANSLYDRDAVARLAERFEDPTVGVVEGRRVDHAPSETETAATASEGVFRDYESFVKGLESRFYSCVGATGPIYAVRRSAYVPLDPSEISDFLEPLAVHAAHGLRQVFEPRAVSREALVERGGVEFGRKVRIITRCLSSVLGRPELWCPGFGVLRCGWRGATRRTILSWQLWSHRLLRWLLPAPMFMLFASSLALANQPLYLGAAIGQVGVYGAAAIGYLRERHGGDPRRLRYPYYFCLANLAAAQAILNVVRGRRFTVWSPSR